LTHATQVVVVLKGLVDVLHQVSRVVQVVHGVASLGLVVQILLLKLGGLHYLLVILLDGMISHGSC